MTTARVILARVSLRTIQSLELYSLTGKRLWQTDDIFSKQLLEVNWGHLPKGIYFLKALEGNKQTVKKIIIQ